MPKEGTQGEGSRQCLTLVIIGEVRTRQPIFYGSSHGPCFIPQENPFTQFTEQVPDPNVGPNRLRFRITRKLHYEERLEIQT